MNLRSWIGLSVLAGVALALDAAIAAPVGAAMQRTALMVRHAEASVLLAAALAGQRSVAVGERGIVLVSDDAGHQWRQVSVPVSVTLTAVRFADAQHGMAVGHAGTVLRTEDGGLSWQRCLDGETAAQLALLAAQASGDATAVKAAQQLVSDGPDKPLFDVLMFDARHALVIGAYGLALATADGGHSWSSWIGRLDNPRGLHLYAARRSGDVLVIVGEQGLVLRSDDGGGSFRRIVTPYRGSFFTLELPSPAEMLLSGLKGNVWRSLDSGRGWSQIALPVTASITASLARADGGVLLASQAGFVFELAGATARPFNATALPALNGLLVEPDGALLTLGVQGVTRFPSALVQGGGK